MGPRLKRALACVIGVAVLAAAAVDLSRAQTNTAPQQVGNAGPAESNAAAPAPPAASAPAVNLVPAAPAQTANLSAALPPPPSEAAPTPEKKPPPPPPTVVRSPFAVMQALDKVTAETMRFGAPVGQQVRYKNLLLTVKACETRDIGSADPQSSAYVVIISAPPGAGAGGAPPAKEVFRGWMFANSPSLNPLQHPIYDAWLIACSAAAPTA
ncbi:MAG TPA: DUF2155 domain-containing protein [Caulobacteraceae bacterium]|nr:DUF2155 domain-containing protein [Caulobacteraceae bacterium]